jgi:acetolactate synthase I/II/III large subunit
MPVGKQVTVAEFIAAFLRDCGVRHVFGFQGGAILKLVDAMILTGGITYVQNYHEQAAAFGADAYARVTGIPGVAIATSGPGATNLVSGIANAHLDSIPCIFFTGQDYTYNMKTSEDIRQNGFQEVDIVSIVRPITKYAVTLSDPGRVRYVMERAWHECRCGRPGAVLIDVPIDVQFAKVEPGNLEGYSPEPEPREELDIAAVIDLIMGSRRPVVLVGGGVRTSGGSAALKRFAESTGIPLVATLNGLDACEGVRSFSGLYGNTFSNLIVHNADLLLVLGSRLGGRQVGKDKLNYTRGAVIRVDVDPLELRRVIPETLSIRSDARAFLESLNSALGTGAGLPDFAPWRAQADAWEQSFADNVLVNGSGARGVDPVRILREICALLDEDAILTADVGQNQMWLAQAFRARGRQRLLNSSGHGNMGFSLPAAIGARIAAPGAQVVSFTGDGGLQMNIQELQLIGCKQLDIKCVVLNNNALGMMREVQKRYFDARYFGADTEYFCCANLELLAKAYSLEYVRIDSHEMTEKIAGALRRPQPCIVDVRLSEDSELLNWYDEKNIFETNRIAD